MPNYNRKTKIPVPLNLRFKKGKFNPDHEFIDSAVNEYLKSGGKITKITKLPEPFIVGGIVLDMDFDDGY